MLAGSPKALNLNFDPRSVTAPMLRIRNLQVDMTYLERPPPSPKRLQDLTRNLNLNLNLNLHSPSRRRRQWHTYSWFQNRDAGVNEGIQQRNRLRYQGGASSNSIWRTKKCFRSVRLRLYILCRGSTLYTDCECDLL